MAVITPQSDVYLLQVPLEINDINQLTFTDATAQYNYFHSLPHLSVHDFTYQRKDNTIRYGANYDSLISYNYVMYRNDAYSNKWFYAFIDGMEYLNDNVTAISIKTDVWQTWQFDLTYKRTFVEREHVSNDTIGKNTVPEDLELGEYVRSNNVGTPTIGASGTMWYAVGVSKIVGTLSSTPASTINGLPNGLFYIFTDSSTTLHHIAEMYDDAGQSDNIYTMFVFPKSLLMKDNNGTISWQYSSATWQYSGGTYMTLDVYVPTSNSDVGTLVSSANVSIPTTLDMSYVPKNNKLFTYPYCFFNISNNAGQTVTYHYEDFNGTPNFKLEGVLSIGCSTKLYPTNYKNMNLSDDQPFDYGLTGAKYPAISWNSDSYTNWCTQNAVNIGVSAVTGLLSAGVQASYGNYIGASTSLLANIGSTVNEVYKATFIPNQVKGNTNVGDYNYSKHHNGFTVFKLSIKTEYAQIIDDFFSMFGYKVNRVKVPNITGRRNWNYVKTIGCYIEADIPQEDLAEIKNMFDKGITLWHHASTFADYSQANDIIS